MARTVTGIVLVMALLGLAFASTAQADDDLDKKIDKAVEKAMKGKDTDFKAYWKTGLNFKSNDGNFKMKIGGRIQLDYWFFDDDNFEEATGRSWRSGWEFRRVRLFVSGQMYKHVDWKIQLDFAGDCVDDADRSVSFKDVYVRLTNLGDCWGCMFPDIYVGHFKEFFSLEELTSSKYITFMERSMPVSTFAPSRNTGFGLFRDFRGERVTVGLGMWGHNTSDCGDGQWFSEGLRGGYDVTGRVTGLLWAPCNCPGKYWHVGASASYQWDLDQVRYRTRPNSHLGDRIVDTDAFDADASLLYGVETAFNYGRFHISAEYIGAMVDSAAAGDPTFWGAYVEAGYFIKGPHRPFNRRYGTFDKVKPCTNFLDNHCCGAGAFQVAARYEMIDLEDGNITGGEANAITAGLNWYLNPNTMVKLNYVLATETIIEESLNAFGIRFQVWF